MNQVTKASNPHLHFIELRDGGPPAVYWAGRPDQDASQGWPSRWTGPVEINTNREVPLGADRARQSCAWEEELMRLDTWIDGSLQW